MKSLMSTEFTVGTFALLGLLVIIYMSLQVDDRSAVGGKPVHYWAKFESVSGLVKKTPVEVAGIKSGFVSAIDLEKNEAKITILLRGDVDLFENAFLAVRSRGVLGDRFLHLEPGSSDMAPIEPGGEIKSTFSESGFEEMSKSVSDVTKAIKAVLQSDDPEGALGKIILNVEELTGRLNDVVGNNEARFDRIMGNMESFTAGMSEITTENKSRINELIIAMTDVAKSLRVAMGEDGSIRNATTRLDETMASLQRIVEKVERGEGTIGKLINDEETVNNINETVESLNDTLGLFKKLQVGVRYRGEYLTSSKELQNMAAITLSPAPDKFLEFEFVDSPKGVTRVIDTTVSSGGTVLSETETIQTNDKVLFSFVLGKRFWDLGFRFGFIRSKGGLGMDYHLLNDRLQLSVEAFDFSRVNDRLQLRAYGTLSLWKYFLLTGGVDDLVTETGQRNAFFGAGIQFTDNDFKALVTALPGAF